MDTDITTTNDHICNGGRNLHRRQNVNWTRAELLHLSSLKHWLKARLKLRILSLSFVATQILLKKCVDLGADICTR